MSFERSLMQLIEKFLPASASQSNVEFIKHWFTWYFKHWQMLCCSSLWQMTQWFLLATNIFLAAWALGISLSFLGAIALVAALFLASVVGCFLPANLGGQEFGFVGVGALLGLSTSEAMALAVVQRMSELVIYPPVLLLWKLKVGDKILNKKLSYKAILKP